MHMKRTPKWLLWILMLLAVLAVGGCGWRLSGDRAYLNIATFYQPGRVWTYETTAVDSQTPYTFTVKVAGTEQYQGHNALRVDTTVVGESTHTRQYMRFSGGSGVILGFNLVDSSGTVITSQSFLPGVVFPAILAPGSSLKSEYQTDNGTIVWTVETQILDTVKETVTVPAGRYPSAIKTHSRVTTTRKDLSTQNTDTVVVEEYTWYDPQVGMVKSQTVEGDHVTRLKQVEL